MTEREDNRNRCKLMLGAVTRAVRTFPLSAEDSEDLIQEAMVRLAGNSDRLPDSPAVLASFCWTTARRTVIDHLRIVARRAPYQCVWVYVDTVGGGDGDSDDTTLSVVPEDVPVELDPFIGDHVAGFLARLSTRHRQTLVLCANGYSYEEIGEATGANKGTVRSRIHYARKRAERELKPLLA